MSKFVVDVVMAAYLAYGGEPGCHVALGIVLLVSALVEQWWSCGNRSNSDV
jgi:hypothetical protein